MKSSIILLLRHPVFNGTDAHRSKRDSARKLFALLFGVSGAKRSTRFSPNSDGRAGAPRCGGEGVQKRARPSVRHGGHTSRASSCCSSALPSLFSAGYILPTSCFESLPPHLTPSVQTQAGHSLGSLHSSRVLLGPWPSLQPGAPARTLG